MRRKQMRRNELPDTCLSTLPSTGQLVVLKHGVRGYYRSEWDTGNRAENCFSNAHPKVRIVWA